MPKLDKRLEGEDIGYLRIVAELWGVEIDVQDMRHGIQELVNVLVDPEVVDEGISLLPDEVQAVLLDLMRDQGKLPWSTFNRRFGGIREMGAGKRDREKPYLDTNASPAEALWYRALVGRTFIDTASGPIEYAYIPDDLVDLIPPPAEREFEPLGRPASSSECVSFITADDVLLNDACTMLAALRSGISLERIQDDLSCGDQSSYPLDSRSLKQLLISAGLLDQREEPILETTRAFLEMGRGQAMQFLVNAWLQSDKFNELLLMPGILAEGEWKNDPVQTRKEALKLLTTIPGLEDSSPVKYPKDTLEIKDVSTGFWSVGAFIEAVKNVHPDFQRPTGDYDSWYLRDDETGKYLNGFEHWGQVEGNLLRFFIAGPGHWLGIFDLALAAPAEDRISSSRQTIDSQARVAGFRFSAMAPMLLTGEEDHDRHSKLFEAEDEKIIVRADGRIRVPVNAPRVARYQVARFAEWQGIKDKFYRYRITSASLRSAKNSGLKIHHLLALFDRYASATPPNLIKALERWDLHGSEAFLENVMVLRCKDAATIKLLQRSPAARFLGEMLGPNAVIIKPGKTFQVLSALADLGYLGEEIIPGGSTIDAQRKLKNPPE